MQCSGSSPTISVILCNYNHARFLPESLQALLDQSYSPLEIIVVDDGSTDDSVQVIESFAQKNSLIRFLKNETNLGAIPSGNKALELSKGDFIYWASADDKVLPGFFERIIRGAIDHPEIGVCCSDLLFFENERDIIYEMKKLNFIQGKFYTSSEVVDLVKKGFFVGLGEAIVSRSAIIEAGKFIVELRWHADWFVLFVAAFRQGIYYVPEALVAMRVTSHSYGQSGIRDKLKESKVIEQALQILNTSEYHDVLKKFNQSGILFVFGFLGLRLIFSHPVFKSFLNFHLLYRALKRELRIRLSYVMPLFFKNIYRQFIRYRLT